MRHLNYKFLSISLSTILCFCSPLTSAQSVTLNIQCWEGYASHYVEGFKKLVKDKHNIDITINITNVSDPNEFWQMARAKKVDLISPAHNIPKSKKWPFIKGGVAIPVNLNNIPNYKYVIPFLQKNDFVTENNKVYGVPYTMGPYGLAYNADKVKEPKSWNVLWGAAAVGKYTISKDYPDANIYTSALILGSTYGDLYDIKKLRSSAGNEDAIQEKLNALAKNAYSLWAGTANPDEFDKLHYATTWGYAVSEANKKGLNWKMARPSEGTTMWVDHWVITSAVEGDKVKKMLAEEWINYGLGIELQVGVIRNWGVSPVITNLGDHITSAERDTFAVGEDTYWKGLSLWENQDKRTSNANAKVWKKAAASRK